MDNSASDTRKIIQLEIDLLSSEVLTLQVYNEISQKGMSAYPFSSYFTNSKHDLKHHLAQKPLEFRVLMPKYPVQRMLDQSDNVAHRLELIVQRFRPRVRRAGS